MVARHYEDKIFSLVSGIHRIVYNLRYVTHTEIVLAFPCGYCLVFRRRYLSRFVVI